MRGSLPKRQCNTPARCSSFSRERLIRTAIDRLRNYLTARDLSDAEIAGGLVVPRLEAPLPKSLRSVAATLLVVFGGLFCIGALYVIGGGIAVVLMPIVMGRSGVGTAMITLFTVCVTFVVSGILLLAARSAARVIRRERRGVRSLYVFARTAFIVVLLAGAITQWLSVAFFGLNDADNPTFDWSIPIRIVELVAAVLLVWAVVILRRFDRQLPLGE